MTIRGQLLRHHKLVAWRGEPIECDEGWDGLVQHMLADLDRAGLNVTVGLIKEKFGIMTVQAIEGPDAKHTCPRELFLRSYDCRGCMVYRITSGAEHASAYVCERCGTTRDVTTEGGWLKTWCGACRKEAER